ncbi:hypothetical protein D9M71_800230 [compost metagenome]
MIIKKGTYQKAADCKYISVFFTAVFSGLILSKIFSANFGFAFAMAFAFAFTGNAENTTTLSFEFTAVFTESITFCLTEESILV